MDGDILVKGDLTSLYSVDLKDSLVAAVADMKPIVYYRPTQNEKLGIDSDYYFNTGVMLLNLQKMREEKTTDALLEYRSNGINYFMDQDAFNYILQRRVHYISFYNNAQYSNIEFSDMRS